MVAGAGVDGPVQHPRALALSVRINFMEERMKRVVVALIAVLPLAFGVAEANAEFPFGGGSPTLPVSLPVAAVGGTVVSTDPAAGTFVANAFVLAPPSEPSELGGLASGLAQLLGGFGGFGTTGGTGGSSGGLSGLLSGFLGNLGSGGLGFGLDGDSAPATTQVTISADSNTKLIVNGKLGTVADMTAGDHFFALFSGSPTDSIQTLTASPALLVFDRTPRKPRQLYAFVGTVTGVDTTAGTVTVDVAHSRPGSLVPAGSAPVPFMVGPDTLVLGGSSGDGLSGGLSSVSVGDIVAGGLVASAGDTLAQIEALPLRVLLDIPVPTGSTTTSADKRRAFKDVLRLLEGRRVNHHSHHRRSHHKGSHAQHHK
jgi:hypothetical protein